MNNIQIPTRLLLFVFLCTWLMLPPPAQVQSTQASQGNRTTLVQQLPVSDCKHLRSAPAIFGVTITDLDQAAVAIPYLRQLVSANERVPLVVRLVFEPIKKSNKREFDERLDDYESKVRELRNRSGVCVLGTIADSYEMHYYLPDSVNPKWPIGYRSYEKWTERLVGKMGELVDIWEVGNEVNGEWYGWKDEEYKTERNDRQAEYQRQRELKRERIGRELLLAYQKIRQVRPDALTAITLLYNADQNSQHCAEFPEYRMNEWAGRHIGAELRSGVDFVLLSYYENTQDCAEVSKRADQLVRVFSSLRRDLFSGDQTNFGFGEISYKQSCYRTDKPQEEINDADRVNSARCQSGQWEYVNRYYQGFDRDLITALGEYKPPPDVKPIRFVGGYFYWYFLQDMVLSKNGESDRVRASLTLGRTDFRKPIAP
jgi:hypothetical protein